MTDGGLFEEARLFLPKYLSPKDQQELFSEIQAFPNNRCFYSFDPSLSAEVLQGDGWRGFIAINFSTLEKKAVPGVVVSNSCDVSPGNRRALPTNILFAPLIRLKAYGQKLLDAGQTTQQVQAILDAIRKQRTTSVFYFPAHENVIEESIVVFDDVRSQPLAAFRESVPTCVFTLNQFAFYLFLVKLSVHFTRLQESLARPISA